MPKYLVETLSQYRMVYIIETENPDSAQDCVAMGDAEEFGQMWLGEMIVSSREVDDVECIRVHDELNDYLVDWTAEQKLGRVFKLSESSKT